MVPVLSIVKPEPSGEREYCLLESKKKAKYYRDTNKFPRQMVYTKNLA